jgi:hypothetical protein
MAINAASYLRHIDGRDQSTTAEIADRDDERVARELRAAPTGA